MRNDKDLTELPVRSPQLQRVDKRISSWMERHGMVFLRYSLGIIFVWFGALKIFGISPAANLAAQTITSIPSDIFIPLLGVWEVAIGLGLFFRPLLRAAIFLLFLQMPGTLLPLFLLPEQCFTSVPFGLTLEGQYIIKNLILISAAIVIGGTVRKKSDPKRFEEAV
ncbi:MAG: hypothetical protein SGI97_06970 [candidate division Zixibacteria bacterium]|nr:hypothetical protein [candidate division Zixibacteria bacterium]